MSGSLPVEVPRSWKPFRRVNVTCLAKKPIVRDPHIFDRKEAVRGSQAREVTCRIQKWNIKAEGFHSILVANARVDWLAMDDDDITKKFPILLEGILQDVFSQRASSAWHKNLRCQCSSQGPVLRQNGETYYNPDANSGLH